MITSVTISKNYCHHWTPPIPEPPMIIPPVSLSMPGAKCIFGTLWDIFFEKHQAGKCWRWTYFLDPPHFWWEQTPTCTRPVIFYFVGQTYELVYFWELQQNSRGDKCARSQKLCLIAMNAFKRYSYEPWAQIQVTCGTGVRQHQSISFLPAARLFVYHLHTLLHCLPGTQKKGKRKRPTMFRGHAS